MINGLKFSKWLLSIGLAFVLAYACIEALLEPDSFLKYIPDFINVSVNPFIFLFLFGLMEAVLVVWLLTGWNIKYPAVFTMFLMIGIIAFNMDAFNVLFRNVSIAFSALALAVLDYSISKNNSIN